MSRIRTPDLISNIGVTIGFLISVKQKLMLKELAERRIVP